MNLVTDPKLLELLHQASLHPMTPAEIFEQRVAFVFGCLDHHSGITKEQVRQQLKKPPQSVLWPIKGVRVEDGKVIITVKGGNDAARFLCRELVALIEK